jgi:hypothetical protein
MDPLKDAKEIIDSAGQRKVLREDEAKSILRCYGIPTTDFHMVGSVEELNGKELRFPVALKLCSENYLHKTDVDGVKLNLAKLEDVRKKMENLRKRFPGENLFLVEPMESANLELIIGLARDATFGLSIMVGMGGILTELYRDVSFRIVPVDEYDAREMLGELKAKRIFQGFRGIQADLDSVIDIVLKVSRIGVDLQDEIDQMDLNPVFVRENDSVVVDAKLILG